jgi:excisionase family DNA binding protein
MITQPAPTEQLLTPADVAALIFVDPKTVSRWATAGRIPSTRTPGGHRRFLPSDVAALMSDSRNRDHLRDSGVPAPIVNDPDTFDVPPQRAISGVVRPDTPLRSSLDRAAVAMPPETRIEAADDAEPGTAACVAVAAETAAAAAVKARRARAFATAQAARGIADEAAGAAAAMRSRTAAQAGLLAGAAAQAKRLVSASATESGAGAQITLAAVRMASTVQAAADAASVETTEAAARVARAVTDAAEQVAVMAAALDYAIERETLAAAEDLRIVTVKAAHELAHGNGPADRRASRPWSVCP